MFSFLSLSSCLLLYLCPSTHTHTHTHTHTYTHTHTLSAAHHILKKSEDHILVEEKKTADTNQILQEAREHLEESRNELKTSRKLL